MIIEIIIRSWFKQASVYNSAMKAAYKLLYTLRWNQLAKLINHLEYVKHNDIRLFHIISDIFAQSTYICVIHVRMCYTYAAIVKVS